MIEERIVAQGHGPLSPSFFCVHSTANVGATAENHASLWSRQPDYAVHLVSDWTKCLHTVPYDRLCWQVGNGNAYVEGIEICEADNREDFERGMRIAAQAVAERLAAHGWGTDRLITHKQAAERWGGSDHTDPIPYLKRWGWTWQDFVNLVEGSDMITDEDIERIWQYRWAGDASKRNCYDKLRYMEEGRTWDDETHASPIGNLVASQPITYTGADGTEGTASLGNRLAYIDAHTHVMDVQIAALSEAVKTLASSQGADPDEIAKAVADAVAKKLESIDLSVTVSE